MKRLAIIGAGAAGLAAAQRLRTTRPDIDIVVLEKSRGVGGRAATRTHGEFVFDHGAQYVKAPSAELEAFLADDTLLDIGQPVWILGADDQITPGDHTQNAEPKWTYRDGITHLARNLAQGLDVRTEIRVGKLAHIGSQWELFDAEHASLGLFDGVLLTPPAPQIRALIAASTLDATRQHAIDVALAPALYRRCLTLSLGYQQPIQRPWYAVINTDREHPIAWLAREHAKPNRAPDDHSVLVAQMAPVWSETQWDTPLEPLTASIHTMICRILDQELPPPMFADRQGWRYALPDGKADGAALNAVDDGLFWAGDYLAGQGRVHRAIETGWEAAERIAATL